MRYFSTLIGVGVLWFFLYLIPIRSYSLMSAVPEIPEPQLETPAIQESFVPEIIPNFEWDIDERLRIIEERIDWLLMENSAAIIDDQTPTQPDSSSRRGSPSTKGTIKKKSMRPTSNFQVKTNKGVPVHTLTDSHTAGVGSQSWTWQMVDDRNAFVRLAEGD